MSIRIHALAKELNVQSKELIDFINKRQDIYHLEIKTPSNAIDPFTAEAIGKDFAAHAAGAKEAQDASGSPEAAVAEKAEPAVPAPEEKPAKAEEGPAEKSKPIPEPVKSSEKKPEPLAPPPLAKKPAPLVPPVRAKAPAAPSAPAGKVPAPLVPPAVSKAARAVPPPLPPRPKIAMPEVRPPQPAKREVQPEVVIKFGQKSEAQREAPRKPAPLTPPIPGGRAPAPLVPPAASKAAPLVPPMPGRAPAAAAQPQSAEKKEFKTIQLKAPIIVREFAKAMDLKPFRLISELMDMGIFASMNQSLEDATAIVIARKHGFDLDIRHRGEQQQPKKKEAAK